MHNTHTHILHQLLSFLLSLSLLLSPTISLFSHYLSFLLSPLLDSLTFSRSPKLFYPIFSPTLFPPFESLFFICSLSPALPFLPFIYLLVCLCVTVGPIHFSLRPLSPDIFPFYIFIYAVSPLSPFIHRFHWSFISVNLCAAEVKCPIKVKAYYWERLCIGTTYRCE